MRAAQAVVARRAINFGKVYTPKSDISELSKGNGIFQKEAKGVFGEKRLLGGWG